MMEDDMDTHKMTSQSSYLYIGSISSIHPLTVPVKQNILYKP